MESIDQAPHDAAEHAAIVAHYERVAPLLVDIFGEIPLVYVTEPEGIGGARVFHATLEHGPSSITTVAYRVGGKTHHAVALNAHNLTWLTRGRFAVEIDSWTPCPGRVDRAAFLRLHLDPQGTTGRAEVRAAALALRARLQAQRLDAIPLCDGEAGLTLWLPFSDAPTYDEAVRWAKGFLAEAVRALPNLLTTARLRVDRGDRVFVGLQSNHPGLCALLPYAVRGNLPLTTLVPATWDEIAAGTEPLLTLDAFATAFASYGARFGEMRAALGEQRLPSRDENDALHSIVEGAPLELRALATPILPAEAERPAHSYLTRAAIRLLADGKTRTIDEILAEGQAAGLLPATLPRKYLYVALHEYITRTLGVGATPAFVQVDATHFRINQPEDSWPAIAIPPHRPWIAPETCSALSAQLTATACGSDPTAFEIAVCEAFAALGFLTRHLGGNGQPDGLLDAPLGREAYRVVLECKTTSPGKIVHEPRPEEPAGFRMPYQADFALLVGAAFGDERSFADELQQHRVAALTVDALVRLLQANIGPDALRALFAPGHADIAVNRLLWEREHGVQKRVAVIADRIVRIGWHLQTELGDMASRSERPYLTEESLLLLVDERLATEGVTTGVTRAEFSQALARLCDTGTARRTEDGMGYVICEPPSAG